ncbi:MAG: protein translocase subunit SecD [Caldisericia bacterium]|nr:protein translocase subunit SecD [Caldisericia bacterium]
MKRIKWEQLVILLLAIGLAFLSIYSYRNDVRYGLDLQGGVHLVLQAEPIEEVVEETAAEEETKTSEEATEKTTETTTTEEVTNEDLESLVPKKMTVEDLEKARSVLEKRINSLGVSETSISIQGTDRLIVDIPGFSDIDQAKKIIGKLAVLTFKDEAGTVIVDGKNLKNATFAFQTIKDGGTRQPVVQLEWDAEGKKKFADGTAANVGKTIKIFLDEEELMAPTVNEAITDGNAVITFGESKNEDAIRQAQETAALLRGGSLPLKLTFLEERIVGPSLGKDTINNTKIGAIVAILAVILYMIFCYKMFGVIGALALLLYAFLYLGFLLAIRSVFSLPAIGAAILSIGGAVDSNVIVFERIKEDYKTGRTLFSSVSSGFAHGWTAIFDSNFAMILAMVVLWALGTPTIKGFAITLISGIIAALITSYFFTRFILNVIAITNPKINEKLFGLKR